jgi:hypothetical protein
MVFVFYQAICGFCFPGWCFTDRNRIVFHLRHQRVLREMSTDFRETKLRV